MNAAVPAERIAAVREFNRMYTKIVGVLDEGVLSTPYTLTEARVLFELSHRDATGTGTLRRTLGLDAGYLSRLLARFELDGLVTRERSTDDGRQQVVRLTAAGRKAFGLLDDKANEHVGQLLAGITDGNQRRVLAAMEVIRSQLGEHPLPPRSVVLRPPRSGDFGWVVQRHGALYAQEYGWDSTFEALVARVVADYADDHDPRCEAGWIAEVLGEPAGCIFCVRKDDTTAKLRLLLLEPSARGHGVGARLVHECVAFARAAGYRDMELWTSDLLVAARRCYEKEGFRLESEEKGRRFGHDLTMQTWRLTF
jgi:DNA-binding MarR family transcriptional regulator/GNAT superfamily N-acetyltransferase